MKIAAPLCLMVGVVLSGCATPPPMAERYVAPPLGSSWVVARKDSGSYGSASVQLPSKRGETMWQGTSHVTFESPETTIVSLPDGRWAGIFRDGKPLFTWDPPAGYEWPLVVGKTFKQNFRFTNHGNQQTQAYSVTTTVDAHEDVTVPAGTFKAFKVRSIDTIGNDDLRWFSPELGIFVKQVLTRFAQHAAGAGTREIELVSQGIRK